MTAAVGHNLVWVLWGIATALATATTILLLITFDALLDAKGHRDLTGLPGSQLDAALAGCLLSAISIILLHLISFFVLLRSTTWASMKPAGFLPFVSASFLHVALFLLLTGMILTSNTHWEEQLKAGGWTSGDSSAMEATYWLCFFTTVIYLIMCPALLLLQRVQRGRTIVFPSDLETSLAQNLRVAAAPMSDSDALPGPGYRRGPSSSDSVALGGGRADTAVPSDYADSVAAARKNYGGGAWGRS